MDSGESRPLERKGKRKEQRFAVALPAYVSTPEVGVWGAKSRLSNVSANGLLIELPAPPPFQEGTTIRVEWLDIAVIGEVRHITCSPGFVRIGVSIVKVEHGT